MKRETLPETLRAVANQIDLNLLEEERAQTLRELASKLEMLRSIKGREFEEPLIGEGMALRWISERI